MSEKQASTKAGGSPPRVRGKDRVCAVFQKCIRITPACAGKRLSDRRDHVRLRDHPRVCGEKPTISTSSIPQRGSPPRVRGKGKIMKALKIAGRITPACAGKSCSCPQNPRSRWDHPRVCGEKRQLAAVSSAGLGSPPRVRGKEKLLLRRHQIGRITPACAGKSFSCFSSFR